MQTKTEKTQTVIIIGKLKDKMAKDDLWPEKSFKINSSMNWSWAGIGEEEFYSSLRKKGQKSNIFKNLIADNNHASRLDLQI